MSSSLIRGKYVIGGGEPIYRDGRFTRVDKQTALEELSASLSGPRTSAEEYRRQIAQDVYDHVEAFYRGYRMSASVAKG